MTPQEFKERAAMARLLGGDYGTGYRRGLRRHFHGERFGTDEQHALWSRMGLEGDPRAEKGRGYRDGLAGTDPDPNPPGRPSKMSGGRRVNAWLDHASVERAEALGKGNVSAGIREALAASLPEQQQN